MDKVEKGSKGRLKRGIAWVQFCVIKGESRPVQERVGARALIYRRERGRERARRASDRRAPFGRAAPRGASRAFSVHLT